MPTSVRIPLPFSSLLLLSSAFLHFVFADSVVCPRDVVYFGRSSGFGAVLDDLRPWIYELGFQPDFWTAYLISLFFSSWGYSDLPAWWLALFAQERRSDWASSSKPAWLLWWFMAGRQARARLVDRSTTPTVVLCFCTCRHSTAKKGWICQQMHGALIFLWPCLVPKNFPTYIHIYISPLLLFCNSTEQAEWAPRNAYVDAKVMKAIAGWKNALVLNCLMSSSLVQKLFWLWSTAMKPCCFWFGWCRANGFAISYWTDILSCKLAIFHPMGNIGRWWEAKAIASAVLLIHRGLMAW